MSSDLTPAERSAVVAYGQHGSIKAAAHALGKSPRTVEQQLASAKVRLGVASSVQAVVVVLIGEKRG